MDHSRKAAKHFWEMIVFTVVTVWGFIVLKYHSNILPWYMGGEQTMEGAFIELYRGCPFTEYS